MITDSWKGCYPSNWKGLVVPEAMSHPAKYSSKLIRRIYEHMISEGWICEGGRVLDPFGGVALGAWDALRLGLDWTGIELEEKFWKLGNQNIDRWDTQYGSMPHWGTARLLHGDSRRLLEVIGGSVQVSVSSPPFQGALPGDHKNKETYRKFIERGHGVGSIENSYGNSEGQLSAMPANQFDAAISSPPYAETDLQYKKNGLKVDGKDHYERPYMDGQGDESYGNTTGQLGAMKSAGFDAAISSPPFLQSEGGTPEPKPGGTIDKALYARHAAGNAKANGYGESDGQLSSMKDGGFEAAVSSPPFTSTVLHDGGKADYIEAKSLHSDYGNAAGQLASMPADEFDAAVSSPPFMGQSASAGGVDRKEYFSQVGGVGHLDVEYDEKIPYEKRGFLMGKEEREEWLKHCNLGSITTAENDFWLAARQIAEQVYQALAPGGHCIWVTKDYVKNKSVVPFSDQWRQLCEAVGFQTLHEHHAMLVHHKGTQHTLEGGTVQKITESKSFFRRLAEKKGSPRIDYETVYCMVKAGRGGGNHQLAMGSPPYAETPIEQTHMTSNKRGDPNNPNYRPSWKTKLEDGYADTKRPYGETPGQPGSMKDSGFDRSLDSP